jgi:DNA-binding GntR family transcriptional regulator
MIREDLLCGRIPSGSRLSESKLTGRFGVSRGMIREALAQLTSEGLLVAKPNCGVTVAPPPGDGIRDFIVPVRRAAETYALKLIFEKLNEHDFEAWDEVLFRMERACRDSDEETIVLTDIAFHRSIIARAGDPDLLAIWKVILVRVRGHFREEVHRERATLMSICDRHRRLVDTLRSGDKKAAIKALGKHIW